MHTRHTVIDSPLGELTLVADGDALTGLYFRHTGTRPRQTTLGQYVEPATDDLFGRAADQLQRIPRRRADTVRSADRRGSATRASGDLGTAGRHRLRTDQNLRRAGGRIGRRHNRIRSRSSRGAQSAQHRRPVPPRRRKGRRPHRLCGRPEAQTLPAGPRSAGTRGGGQTVLMAVDMASAGGGRRLGCGHGRHE